MSIGLRSAINRWRRALWDQLAFRIVFGERGHDGEALPLTRISPTTCIEHPPGLILGDHVFIGHFNYIEALHGVRIDEGTQITNYVSILSHSSHRSLRLMGRAYAVTPPGRRVGFVSGPVHIGPYCFIGPHTTIEANTVLGRGCQVASHSRVRGVFPDFAVIAGSPARIVGDTRDGDADWLDRHPSWRGAYDAWALGDGPGDDAAPGPSPASAPRTGATSARPPAATDRPVVATVRSGSPAGAAHSAAPIDEGSAGRGGDRDRDRSDGDFGGGPLAAGPRP